MSAKTVITIDDLARWLGLSDAGPLNSLHPQDWPESMATMPTTILPFHQDAFLEGGAEYCRLEPEMLKTLRAGAARLEADAMLRALAWHGHRMLHACGRSVIDWPSREAHLGELAGTFHALLLISAWQQAQMLHRERNIPREVVAQTMTDVPRFLRRYARRHGGAFGLTPLDVGAWLMNHFRGRLYRLGRLQFMTRRAGDAFCFLRHRNDNQLLVLAQEKLCCDARGWIAATDAPDNWSPTLTQSHGRITGHVIDPVTASVRRKPADLDAAAWSPALQAEDLLLDIHIPDDGPMDFEMCAASMQQALVFWQAYFPMSQPRGFVCTSWLLDPQLRASLTPASNLVRFLSEFYLMPASSDPWSIFRFVFDLEVPYGAATLGVDLADLPQKTSLQRAVVAHAQAGEPWRKVQGLLLREDLPKWGMQVYQRQPI